MKGKLIGTLKCRIISELAMQKVKSLFLKRQPKKRKYLEPVRGKGWKTQQDQLDGFCT